MSSQNQFFIYLPSNTSGYPSNSPNKFRTHLPRMIDFHGDWVVGLHSISYTHSWNNVGTTERQWIEMHLPHAIVRVSIPDSAIPSVEYIENNILNSVKTGLRNKQIIPIVTYKKLGDNEYDSNTVSDTNDDLDTRPIDDDERFNPATGSIEESLPRYKRTSPQTEEQAFTLPTDIPDPTLYDVLSRKQEDIISAVIFYLDLIKIIYNKEISKFTIKIDHHVVQHVAFSPQIGYMLGFENIDRIENGDIAKYSADLKGGISSFGVYTKGLTENIVCGSEFVSLLRIVNITGSPKFGDLVENIYNTPIYLRVLPKQLSEIEVELRTVDGDARLIPFHFGVTTIVLVFKKVINF